MLAREVSASMGRPRLWEAVSPRGPMLRALCFGNAKYSSAQFEALPNCVLDANGVKKSGG